MIPLAARPTRLVTLGELCEYVESQGIDARCVPAVGEKKAAAFPLARVKPQGS